jgi:hypothetical protein
MPFKLDPAWLNERAKYLSETAALKFGIPMQVDDASEDYWGAAINPEKPFMGVQAPGK